MCACCKLEQRGIWLDASFHRSGKGEKWLINDYMKKGHSRPNKMHTIFNYFDNTYNDILIHWKHDKCWFTSLLILTPQNIAFRIKHWCISATGCGGNQPDLRLRMRYSTHKYCTVNNPREGTTGHPLSF